MEIRLGVGDEQDANKWDQVVHNSIQGSVFHTWEWLKVAEQHTGLKFYPIIGYKGSTVIGIYPLYYRKAFGLTSVFSPPPATDIPYLGPVIVDYQKLKQSKKESILKFFHYAVDEFIKKELKANYTMIIGGPDIDPRPYKWTDYRIEPLFDYRMNLVPGIDQIWKDLDKDARDHIKKIENINARYPDQITVVEGKKEDLIYLYDSLLKRYKEQKEAVRVTREYLFDVFDCMYPEHLKLFMVRNNDANINGVVTLLYQNKMSYWIGAPKPDFLEISSNEINHWEAIKWACENGYHLFEEFGAGTERFSRVKAKYNPYLSVHFKFTKYSSPVYHLMEIIYKNIVKPIYGKYQATR